MPRITDVPVLLPASTAPDQAAEHPAPPAPPATARRAPTAQPAPTTQPDPTTQPAPTTQTARTPPRARLGPARQPRRRGPALAAGQHRRAGLGAEAAAAGHRLEHGSPPGDDQHGRLRDPSGRHAGIAGADGDRVLDRCRRRPWAGPRRRSQPGRARTRWTRPCRCCARCPFRPGPGVHRLVRHRPAAQGAPDRSGRHRPALPEHVRRHPQRGRQAGRTRPRAGPGPDRVHPSRRAARRAAQALVGLRQSLGAAWLALVVAEQLNANAAWAS